MEVVQIVRMTTGEELLCKMDSESVGCCDEITISTPVIIIPTGDGKISFMPYMPYTNNKEMTIKGHSVMFIVEPSDELTSQYKTMIGDVIVPSKPKIVI